MASLAATLPRYTPEIPPFEHQAEALAEGWRKEGYAYLLEMGLGKTRVLVDNFCMLYQHQLVDAILVIAPKSVYTNWTRISEENPGEVQKWLWPCMRQGLEMYTWVSGKSQKDVRGQARMLDVGPVGPRVLAVNAEALSMVESTRELCRRFLRAHRTLVVVDESTLMKERTSKRTKTITELGRMASYRRILTGSPLAGSPSDLFSQFQFVKPGCLGFNSYVAYRARYCLLRDMDVGGRRITTEVGVQNLDELANTLKTVSFRRTKSECLDLPPKVYERREVPLTPDQEKAYREMRTSAMAVLAGGETVTTSIVITQLLRMHQLVCGHIKTDAGDVIRLQNNRIEALREIATDSKEPMIVWCNYKSDLAAASRMLRGEFGEASVAEWHGDIPMRERESGEADFLAGRRRYMVASQQAGGRGRTWISARTVVYYSNSHDLELREQSEDRAHRIGQLGTVLYIDLVTPGTVDEKIIDALRKKKNVTQQVLSDGVSTWI